MGQGGFINGFTYGRVLTFALLLFFVSAAWAGCTSITFSDCRNYYNCKSFAYSCGTCCKGESCGGYPLCSELSCCTETPPSIAQGSDGAYYGGYESSDKPGTCGGGSSSIGSFSVVYWPTYRCTDECSADSISCLTSGGSWEPDPTSECGNSCTHCDAQCECEENGGVWNSANGGYCVPNCQSKFCCDSLNQNLPVETDTTWEGCVATDPSNDKCVVIPTVENNTGSTTAECTAKSRYRVCTTSYVWNRTTGTCTPLSSNNCVNIDVPDERCTNVLCEAFQTRSLSALQYDGATQCYVGYQLVQDMMVCDNGIREERGRSTEAFQVCDSYLEANNMTIQDYISGQNGGTAVIGGNSAGVGGGGSGGSGGGEGDYGGCVGNGCSSPLDGGTSVNAQGDTVMNSASPQIGNVWTPQTNVVTQYDSTTGTTTIVKNSQGGDSTVTSVRPTGVRCLGVSGGVATLTNGNSTWTCAGVQSCSQAVLSASLNGGSCSASSNGVFYDNYNSDNMPLILDENGNAILTSETDNLERAMEQLVRVMNGIAHNDTLNRQKVHQIDRNHQDSLWKATFGDGLDAVKNMRDYIESASSANSQAIASATSQITSANSQAIGSASSANSQAIKSAASSITGAIGAASGDITGAVGNVKNAVNSASSANSQAIASATSHISSVNSQGFGNVASAVNSASTTVGGKIDSMKGALVDTLHSGNNMLEFIRNALDTNGITNRDINGVRDAVTALPGQIGDVYSVTLDDWYNDKLKLTLDSNAQKVASAIDSLQLTVTLDSIKIDVPKDSVVDSIYGQLKSQNRFDPQAETDTLDFGRVMQMAFDSTVGDTSVQLDSSFSQYMASRAGETTLDSDGWGDSVMSTLQQRLDSAREVFNERSDSAVNAYHDSLIKYAGIDTMGHTLERFFETGTNTCPRDCFTITVPGNNLTKNQPIVINKLAEIFCDWQIFNNLTPIDFMKAIIRIIASIFCMFLIMEFLVPAQKGKKGNK